MIWVLLAALGVPVWLIIGALGGALWSRRRFRAQEGVFPLALRGAQEDASWPRMTTYGRLVRDVLVVNRGLGLVRTEIYPITGVQSIELSDAPRKIDEATGRSLGVEAHDDIEVAVSPLVGGRLDRLDKGSPAKHVEAPTSL